jgi:hypothetical protein
MSVLKLKHPLSSPCPTTRLPITKQDPPLRFWLLIRVLGVGKEITHGKEDASKEKEREEPYKGVAFESEEAEEAP